MKKLIIIFCLFASGISAQNWFPLHIGNSWDYFTWDKVIGGYYNPPSDYRYITKTKVLDTLTINNKLYYKVRSFPRLSGDLWIRYDENENKLFIYQNNAEHLFMNFNLVGGNMFLQYILNGNYRSVMTIEKFPDTTYSFVLKGYTIYPYIIENYNYFYPNIGFYSTEEITFTPGIPHTNLNLIEYLLINSNNDTIYYKHNHKVQLIFNPKNFLPNIPILRDTIIVKHVYNDLINPNYIDSVFFEYYYSDGINLTSKTKIKLSLLSQNYSGNFKAIIDFPIDTLNYQSGYHLYYRVGAKDIGIIPTYSYVPDTGYIKLFWRDSTLSVTDEDIVVENFQLEQNYPNPFNPSTMISWQSPLSGWQTLKIYDILGNEIATLVDEYRDAGRYEVEFNAVETRRGLSLPSGVYFYQLRVTEPSSSSGQVFVETKKMILMR